MSEIALSFVIAILKAFFTELVKSLAKRIISRKKEGTTPITRRDGSK